ncbi:MAG: hypothetical protein J0I06_24550 [Planctomycetes bacterium]|nr:hypothetical protein [Planctomycetota bacterium]
MRLICPHCMSGVTVPDDAAGKDATCPNCGKTFPTPARYSAQVTADPPAPASTPAPEVAPMPTPPAPPPGYVPPIPAPPPVADSGFLSSTTSSAPVEAPSVAGYTTSIGFTFDPKLIAWLPAIFLLLTLILSVFTWVGSYAGHTAVYSQGPWRALVGGVYRDFTLEKMIPIPPGWADKLRSDWPLMLFYLLALILAVALAWGDRGLRVFDPQKYRQFARVWTHRQGVIFGLAALALLLSLVQVWRGFGMERAMRQVVDEKYAETRQNAANSPSQLDRIDWEKEQEYAKFNIETTTWAYLALTCNALAVLTAVARWALARRVNKPPPKILLHY